MKAIKRITTAFVAGAMIFMTSCEPIEEREMLKNSFDPDDIELEVVQSSDGTGNGLTLKMNSPGIYGYWDTKLGKVLSNEASLISPFMGNVTFNYHVATPIISGGDPSNREYITKSIQVNVQVVDNDVPEAYYDLVGENLSSKTWVLDRSSTNWWYMSSGGNEPPNPYAVWWNASECCAPSDQAGKMVFDLNGSANYTYFDNASNETGTAGSFSFNADYTKLTIEGGVNILGAKDCGTSLGAFGVYDIVELTEDRMVLFVPKAQCTSGWTWIFVPEP